MAKKKSIIEGIWRMQWNNGKMPFERYRQLRLKMQRQAREIERLRQVVENIAELAQVYPPEGKQDREGP
jgi:hypothetical protein